MVLKRMTVTVLGGHAMSLRTLKAYVPFCTHEQHRIIKYKSFLISCNKY